MSSQLQSNGRTPSTTRFGTGGRIRSGPAGGPSKGAAKRPPRLSQHPQRTSLTLKVTYRGGSECWWMIEARGRVWRRPGTLALHDVLQDIYDGVGGVSQ